MNVEYSKEWCLHMAQDEGEIGVGRLAIDPLIDCKHVPVITGKEDSPNVAFSRLVNLMRRRRGMSLDQLANKANIDMVDLYEIERDPQHKPELRTTYQLANYFKISQSGLMQLAGLAVPKDAKLYDESVRFAARSESTAALTPEECAALEAFVAVLSEQK